MDRINVLSGVVVGAGIRIHQKLGPGLLESVYEVVLARDARRPLTYLEILDLRLGLLLNFGMATMKDGIRRIAN